MLVEAGLAARHIVAAPYWFAIAAVVILLFLLVGTFAIGKGRPGRK